MTITNFEYERQGRDRASDFASHGIRARTKRTGGAERLLLLLQLVQHRAAVLVVRVQLQRLAIAGDRLFLPARLGRNFSQAVPGVPRLRVEPDGLLQHEDGRLRMVLLQQSVTEGVEIALVKHRTVRPPRQEFLQRSFRGRDAAIKACASMA